MTPFVQSIILLALSAIIIPSVVWLISAVLQNQRDMLQLKTEVASLRLRVNEHHEYLKNDMKTMQRLDRNIVAIARELKVKDLETE